MHARADPASAQAVRHGCAARCSRAVFQRQAGRALKASSQRQPGASVIDRAAAVEHIPGVLITGAGISGLSAAVGLQQLGVPVTVLERAPQLRASGGALSLWSNAWRALDALGVGNRLRADAQLLTNVELMASSGRLLRRFSLTADCSTAVRSGGVINETRGVQRAAMLATLAEELQPGVLRFGAAVDAVQEAQDGRPAVALSDGRVLSCDVLVGADGARSAIASHLGLSPASYSGYTAYRGLASFPDAPPLPRDTVRQLFGAGVRAGMYALAQQQVYWFVCFNAEESAPAPADAAARMTEALAVVEGWQGGIIDCVRHTPTDTISRATIRDRWTAGAFGRGCVTLAGDAAHPMTPNLGQGGCTAIEDSVVLARTLAPLLSRTPGRDTDVAALAAALRAYERERSARCLPLTLRSWAFGAALQLPYAPVVAVRDAVIEHRFSPAEFLAHTAYDCGTLTMPR